MAHRPTVRNPFPQLSRIAVTPFFNLSDEPTLDGRRFALAYFAELQAVPGFEVLPLSVVETAMRQQGINLDDPSQARKLARILGVDAVVVGAVTDYSPYYPPRCSMQVQWWAANPCYHPIPPGYGLPWETPDEEFIPESLVFEAEMATARAQLEADRPWSDLVLEEVVPPPTPPPESIPLPRRTDTEGQSTASGNGRVALADGERIVGGVDGASPSRDGLHEPPSLLPSAGPAAECLPSYEPVLNHTRIYHGHDRDFTEALATYAFFREDARFGGWQSYLQRSEDFIRFCCHLHISEMLAARGGAGETRVVWEWSHSR